MHGPEFFTGSNESIDHLNVLAMAAYGSVSTDVKTLLKFGADFPEPVKENLRRAVEISGDEMKDIVSLAAETLNATHQSGLVYSDKEKQKFLRRQIGEEIVMRMEGYLYDHEIAYGDWDVTEETADQFMGALKGLLVK